MADNWELRQGVTVVGTLNVTDEDLPWYTATFAPTDAFTPYQPIFEEGNRLRTQDDADAWGAWNDKVKNLGLRLVRLGDQVSTGNFILYIDGRDAEFRPIFDTDN